MPKLNQLGVVHLLVPILLILGVIATTYLILEGPKIFQPKAAGFLASPCNNLGDVNDDGKITSIDALHVKRILANNPYPATKQPYTDEQKRRADVNGVDGVTNADADEILKYVANLTQTFSGCNQASPTPYPSSTPQAAKKVFVTSTTYNGNLGGLSGADSKCQARANAANLGGNWKAWLSDHATSASYRIVHNSGPYKLLDGTIVANNWDDLVKGSIQNSINRTEFNSIPSYMSCIWTSTETNGNLIAPASNVVGCFDYTVASSDYSWCGRNGSSDSNWTKWSTDRCDQSHPLYCFEQ